LSYSIDPQTTGARWNRALAWDNFAGSGTSPKGERSENAKRPPPAFQVSLESRRAREYSEGPRERKPRGGWATVASPVNAASCDAWGFMKGRSSQSPPPAVLKPT